MPNLNQLEKYLTHKNEKSGNKVALSKTGLK